MRLRIIAYGLAVVVILTGISIITFWAMERRPGRGIASDWFASGLETADPPARQHLLDEALDKGVEVSIYSPDDSLIATNVRPPIPALPNRDAAPPPLPPPPIPPEDDPQHGRADDPVPARVRPEGPVGGPMPTAAHALLISGPGQMAPGMFFAPGGARVFMRPARPPAPILRFAIALLLSMVALVLLSFPVAAAMTRKLTALADAARCFGEGDLSKRADASGSDEVSRTAQAFNQMAARIGELRLAERQLLAGVSHELRTPMARMSVLLELTENNPDEAARYVGELARDLRELESLLEQIIENFRLGLASPRSGAPWLVHRVALDLRDLVAEVVTEFQVRAPDRPLTVNLADKPVVHGVDRTLARHALMNLIDNARKYSPPGSAIEVAVDSSGEILVSDRGHGIDPADLPLVFEPFFRADKSRNRSTGGVGLGLTFVKLVAVLHQGDVSVDSRLGVGTTFRLSFGAADRRTQSNTFGTHS